LRDFSGSIPRQLNDLEQSRDSTKRDFRAFVVSANLGQRDGVGRLDRPAAEIERPIADFIARVSEIRSS
jgi:hypothetical protein